MKMRKYFILIAVAFVLMAGLFAQANIEIEDLFPRGEITDRRAFLQGMVFAQEEINDMRREGHLLCGRALGDRKELLDGLEAVEVVVGVVGPNAGKYGLTEQLLQTDTELRLRMHGIKVGAAMHSKGKELDEQTIADRILQHWREHCQEAINAKSDEDFLQSAREWVRGDPSERYQLAGVQSMLSIELHVNIDEERRCAAFQIQVELLEGAYLFRNGAFWFAPVWKKRNVGTCSSSNLKDFTREVVRDFVDEFINAYLAANPKDRSSEEAQ